MKFIHGRLTVYIGGEWTFIWEEDGEKHKIEGSTEYDTYPSLEVLNNLSSDEWEVVIDETQLFRNKYPVTKVSCVYLMKKEVDMGSMILI